MTGKKICVSIFADSFQELTEKIAVAAVQADIIELRLDKLKKFDLTDIRLLSDRGKPLILTYRSRKEGGEAPDNEAERIEFWQKLIPNLNRNIKFLIDTEADIAHRIVLPEGMKKIASYHDLTGTPEKLDLIYDELTAAGDIAKLVTTAHDAADTVPLWHLLERAKQSGRSFIPIAMGEPGKMTRLLAPALGSLMTYGSEGGNVTASGQFSAADMKDVYRVNALNSKTKVFGVIAGDTSYSMSPYIHNAAFAERGLDCVFVPLQVSRLNTFIEQMVKPNTREVDLNFAGFAVTNPHKQLIMDHLENIDETAKKIGAVNTVYFRNGMLCGTNTDAAGFIGPLLIKYGSLTNSRIGIIGAGGAARACVYELVKNGADVTVFARDLGKAAELAETFGQKASIYEKNAVSLFAGFDIIVNTTPLGTRGELENETAATSDMLSDVKLVYDLVYTPQRTVLLAEAEKAGAQTLGGLEMLITQGALQFELWTNTEAPIQTMTSAALTRLGLS